jgi:uncharacterized iron-regulated membrane protein
VIKRPVRQEPTGAIPAMVVARIKLLDARIVKRPQDLFLRKMLFQIHLWVGIGIGLYVLVICVSGSVLVYRNELYRAFAPQPVTVTGTGDSLTLEELKQIATRTFPGDEITDVRHGKTPNHAAEITLARGDQTTRRLLHPFTGQDLGNLVPAGFRMTAWLLDLHDNLLAGETGRRVNGVGGLLLVVLCVTGAMIWWPGIGNWRRSLTVSSKSKRLTWSLHSALGFWFVPFLLMWAVTGAYLSFPGTFSAFFDWLEPYDEANPAERMGDTVQYWLAYLHFGRLGGRGIPGCGRGLCDSVTKATWAVFGLVPAVLFITGALMWWNRVLRPAARRRR